jgi:hypothetical protein
MLASLSPRRSGTARFDSLLILLVLAACGLDSGCVLRRMTIRSNPPGALVYVDDYEIGVTPVSTDFIYYGQRNIRLVKDGYETLSVMQTVPPPWYQIPPLDFVAENLVPGEIRDQRTFSYQMTPQSVVPTDQLLSRAENLRRGVATVGGVAPSRPAAAVGPSLVPPGPALIPAPEPIPTPEAVGGQPVYPLPPSGR